MLWKFMMMSLFCSGVVVYLVSYELGFQKYIQERQNRFILGEAQINFRLYLAKFTKISL